MTDRKGKRLRRHQIGALGEKIAAHFLRSQHAKILVRNFRAPRGGEADLVIRSENALVFVEVKTRSTGSKYKPSAAVDAKKRQLLRRAARAYLGMLEDADMPVRFDIIEVIVDESRKPDVNWLRNAFSDLEFERP